MFPATDLMISYQVPTRAVDLTTGIHIGAGFCAELVKVIDNLIYFDPQHIRSARVDWSNQFFPYKDAPGENGWGLYFEPINVPEDVYADEPVSRMVSNGYYHMTHHQLCTDQWVLYKRYLPFRLHAHEIIERYIRIKPHVQNMVDEFYNNHLKGHYCIGVHVRFSKAHATEMPGRTNVALETYFAEIEALLNEHGREHSKIYLATDSHYVVAKFRERYPASMLACIDAFRAQFNEDPHIIYVNTNYWMTHPAQFHARKPGYKGGLDTLVDCLLLSRCDTLVHSVSNVATIAVLFNPHIESLFLPRGVPLRPCGYQTHLVAPE